MAINAATVRAEAHGPAGAIECAVDQPAEGSAGSPRGVAVLCHPHPQFGGTMDNKVVQTLARACVQHGWTAVRFNFRGIGASAGAWSGGDGEVDDALAVVAAQRRSGEPLLLGGFSFGGFVAARVAEKLGADVQRLLLVAPAVVNFAVPAVPAGTLLIHGEHDDVVPLSAVLDWARPQNLPLTLIPGAGHFFHGQLTLLKTLIGNHLAAAEPNR